MSDSDRGKNGLIEDYALIGNRAGAALVGRNGAIDWLCLPRFDSAACFSALIGDAKHGRWLIAPDEAVAHTRRHYRDDTLILETLFETANGQAVLIDFMTRHDGAADVVRIVRGLRGRVSMHTDLVVRFEYGSVVPWVTRRDDGRMQFTAGPDRLLLDTPVALHGEELRTVGTFEVGEGEAIPFVLSWTPSHYPVPPRLKAVEAMNDVERFWSGWVATCTPTEEWSGPVRRSLVTLKALTHAATGGIVAAPTTALPEKLGGSRNWDYRFCWLRDATFTLYALLAAGFLGEAKEWREWLVRAIAGDAAQVQTMYGVAGERVLTERELPWLPGYQGAQPVRVGNAAAEQVQLDIYGELLDALYVARQHGLEAESASWALERRLVDHLEGIWDQPDNGIWEVRGDRKHFTHSKVMAWVAFDRAVRSIQEFGLDGPVERWTKTRDRIHAQVCKQGFSTELNSFVQSYGTDRLDAALLLIPVVGFLPPDDPRVRGTVEAIEKNLRQDGFVMRHNAGGGPGCGYSGEGAFLACSFWLADNYILQGRHADAAALFRRLLSLRNDVGLLAEEYDVVAKRQVGNFPQGFSHLALINTAHNFLSEGGPAHQRSGSAMRRSETPRVSKSRA